MAKSAAVNLDVRWRETGVVQWGNTKRIPATSELVFPDLDRSKTYDVQVRAVASCGAMSDWATTTGVIPANNQRIDNGNINMLRTGGIGSAWTGFTISYTSSPTSATISCTSGTLQDGAGNPTYAASSAVVSGTASTTVTYYLYYDDPTGAGGTVSLGTTTAFSDLSANQGRISVGSVDVVFPATGTGSGSGDPGGGAGPCPVVEAWVYGRRSSWLRPRWVRAGNVRVGDWLWLPRERRWGQVTYSQAKLAPCVRIDTARNVPLSCSTSAPIGVTTGADVLAPNLLGVALPSTINGQRMADTCTAITPLGQRWVQHITCEHSHFLAGDIKGRGLDHHNLKPRT